MVVSQSIVPTWLGLLVSFAVVGVIAVILMRIFKWNRTWWVHLLLAPMIAVALLVSIRTSRSGLRVYMTENQGAFEEPVAGRQVFFHESLAQRPTAVVSDSPPAPLVLPSPVARRPQAASRVPNSSAPLSPPPAAVDAELTAWTTPDLPGFTPDVYPSAQAAARGLAADALRELTAVFDGQKSPESIDVFGDVPSDILTAVAGVLGGHNRSARLSVFGSSKPASSDASHVLVSVRIDFSQPETGSSTHQHSLPSHRVQLAVQGARGERHYTAEFVDKPWFDNFARFVADHPREHWLLAQSNKAYTSPVDAEYSASQDAARKLASRVFGRLVRSHGGPWSSVTVPRVDEIERIILSDINAGVSDRFIQSFSRPYGQVWRAALLVDTSDKTINSLASCCERLMRTQGRTWIATFASIGGLVVLICLVYVFLNVMTKGYYTRVLRVSAAGAVLVGIVAALFVVWWLMGVRLM